MTRYVFDEVVRTGQKTVACSRCGRKIRRQRTFVNTINPWNTNPDGTPRTQREIWDHLGDLIAAWKTEPESHAQCEPA